MFTKLDVSLDWALIFTVTVFIASCLLLPSGSIFNYNVKLYLSVLSICLAFLTQIANKSFDKHLLLMLTFFTFFIVYGDLVGFATHADLSSIASHNSAIIATFLPIWLGLCITKIKHFDEFKLLNILTIISLVYILIKNTFAVMLFFKIITMNDYWSIQENIFGNLPISMEIDNFVRLNMTSDFIIPPITLYTFWLYKENKIKLTTFIIILTLFIIGIIITYSRYLWVFYFITLLCGLYYLFNGLSVSQRSRYLLVVLISCAAMMACCFLMFTDYDFDFIKFITERYSGEAAVYSDTIRDEMYRVLVPFFWDSVLLGNGLGSYPKGLIRFFDTPWNYELQWLAIAGQLGVVWFVILWGIIIHSILNVLKLPVYEYQKKLHWLIALSLWLAVGFFNCFLITSAAGVIHLTYILMGKHILSISKQKYINHESTVVDKA